MRGMDVAAADTLRMKDFFLSPAAKLTIIHSAVMRDLEQNKKNTLMSQSVCLTV